MRQSISITLLAFFTFLFYSCDNTKADRIFGDSYFKTSIAIIELYKIRHGNYPDSLQQMEYTSGFEEMALTSVKYVKLQNGYKLDLIRGHMGFPKDLTYPAEFWKGLGCIESNLK